jgi:septal ring factor EnvC (AmiA/AmiB activator)
LPKLTHLEISPSIWVWGWLLVPLMIALLVTLVLTLLGRANLAEATAEIDRRFGLRERLSSAWLLSADERATPLGQALSGDANRRAEKLDVRDQFKWGFNKRLLIPLLPALLAGVLCFVPDRAPKDVASAELPPSLNQIKASTAPLLEQIREKRALAEKQGLTAAVDMFKKLEGELADLQKNSRLDTKQSLAKLHDLKQQLAQRRQELGTSDSLKKNLQNLEKFEAGPAEKLAEALKQGDFQKAEQALEQLREEMKNGQLDSDSLQQLQKQLAQLEKGINEAASAHEQAKEAVQQQIERAKASGDMQQAGQLQSKLEQMQAQDGNMAQMQQMSESLSKIQQSLQQGDLQSAEQAMQQMAGQMQQMNQSDAELQDLDQLLDSLAQSKSQMMCEQCSGAGCASCMSSMTGQMPGEGMGMGEGKGQGERPEEESDVDFFESRVRDQMKMGESIYGGKVGGENRKGTTQLEVQEAVLGAFSQEPEPLDNTPLPKTQLDHSREYFNSFRKDEQR